MCVCLNQKKKCICAFPHWQIYFLHSSSFAALKNKTKNKNKKPKRKTLSMQNKVSHTIAYLWLAVFSNTVNVNLHWKQRWLDSVVIVYLKRWMSNIFVKYMAQQKFDRGEGARGLKNRGPKKKQPLSVVPNCPFALTRLIQTVLHKNKIRWVRRILLSTESRSMLLIFVSTVLFYFSFFLFHFLFGFAPSAPMTIVVLSP